MPFVLMPDHRLAGGRSSLLALVNVGLGIAPARSIEVRASARDHRASGVGDAVARRGSWRSAGRRSSQPERGVHRDRSGGTCSSRPRTRSRPSRPARSAATPRAVGRRHLDDAADRRREADADPAAHRPAGVEAAPWSSRSGWARRSARRSSPACRPTPSSSSRPCPTCSATTTPTPPRSLRRPGRPGDHRRRPEPPRADRRAVRHHRHRPAAADRELGRLGHLLARVLRGRARPPDPGRRHDAVGPVRRSPWTSSRTTSGRSPRSSRT